MFNIRKQCVINSIKEIVKREGMTVAEVQEHFRGVIEEVRTSDDPEQQAMYCKLFGRKTPTPEEFIYVLSKQTGKVRF
ncbi:hypothetical protein [Longibaculum muris]|uniref:hypothetical protein n=1 Tax=Longibaculum muris TaxID=1796628 RepID=UPI0012B6F09B|nr:hypothetical protein [Longibaculum muris]